MRVSYYLNVSKFKRLVELRGFRSLNDFAEKTGIHRNTLRGYLARETSVFTSIFDRICDTLEIDQLDLITSLVGSETSRVRALLLSVGNLYAETAFLLIGSRAKGKETLYSDWDIGVTNGPVKLSTRDYLAMKAFIADAAEDFPAKIDVVNLDAAPEWFLKGIDYEPVFLCGNERAYYYCRGLIDGFKKEAA